MKEITYFTGKNVFDVEAGGRHSLALVSGKIPEVYTWGFGDYQQLGQGDHDD
jgi:alpha-tubulin suppressor-like RCC1 family protein